MNPIPEQDVVIAARRARMLDMLEGRHPMKARFDMGYWFYEGSRNGCGTVACAIGNYALAYPDSGVGVDKVSLGGGFPTFSGIKAHSGGEVIKEISKHFDISFDDAHYCFMPDSYNFDISFDDAYYCSITPLMVAERFRDVCGR